MIQKFKDFYSNNLEYQKENNKMLFESQQTYWSKEENRNSQAQKTSEFFAKHPEAKETLSVLAQAQ